MASPDPKEWLEYSAEQFNIDDNFDFSKSIWANSILDTVYMEVEGIESSMRKSLEELAGIEELETYLINLSLYLLNSDTFLQYTSSIISSLKISGNSNV